MLTIFLLIILFLTLMSMLLLCNKSKNVSINEISQLEKKITNLQNKIKNLENNNEKLDKIRIADENIFKLIRCINIPQTPSCRKLSSGETICRSRQINCNKMKLVLENDPVAIERIKIATDKYYQSNKKKNESELMYPIKEGWLF